jgi:cation transport regulator ChaC
MVAIAETLMAKRNDVSVKMDAKVVEDCRLAATYKGMSLAEYLSETMRAIANRDIEEEHARRVQRTQPPKGKGPK